MTNKEAMQMVLDAIKDAKSYIDIIDTQEAEAKSQRLEKALEVLSTALEQWEQEPVAWTNKEELNKACDSPLTPNQMWGTAFYCANVPLYTVPPQREWQNLTHEEWQECLKRGIDYGWFGIVDAVQTKLKEKNT